MATTTKKYQIFQKTSEEDLLLIHPETDAGAVKLEADGLNADNVKDALVEINENIASITGGGVVTGVKGEAEETYRLGQVNITRENIGLGNVDNTSDADKPVSTATRQALDAKQDKLTFDSTPTAESANPVTSGGVKSAIDSAKAEVEGEIPDVSEFITRAVNDLVNYYTKTEIDGKVDTLEGMISSIPKFSILAVDELPESEISSTTIYLLKTSETESGNLYTEYIYVEGEWEELGTQKLDLTGYVTTEALNTAIADFLTEDDVNGLITTALAAYTKTEDLSAIAKSGNLSDAIQDTTHRVVTDAEKATWNTKQNALTFDETPTNGSANPVKSGGIYTAIQTVQGDVNDIVDGTTPVAKATAADTAVKATAAGKLNTARTIGLQGDATGSANFDGSANASINVSLSNTGVAAGSYSAVNVDTKGRVVAGAQLWEVVPTGSSTPSENLAIGGFAFIEIPEA